MVDETLKMRPADLSEPLDLPAAPYLTRDDIAAAAQSVADAIAHRVASYATRSRQLPMAVLRSHRDDVERAIEHGRSHVFDGALAGMRAWAVGFETGTVQHEFAMARMRMVLDLRESFAETARGRISRVLHAATEPYSPSPAQAAHQAPAETTTRDAAPRPPQPSTPAATSPAGAHLAAHQTLAQLRKAVTRCAVWAWVHAAICALGTLITVSTISAASYAGGRYVVFWGAILFGAIGCIRNISRYTKGKEAIAQLERKIAAAR